MENSSCELLSLSYPKVSEVENHRWNILVNLIFNNTIHAMRKTSSSPNNLKTLLLNFAVTDVGVGLIVQPVFNSLLVKWLQQNSEDYNLRYAFIMMLTTFCLAVLGCCGCKCRQVLGNSSSSQISGACDSQACSCWGDLTMVPHKRLFI